MTHFASMCCSYPLNPQVLLDNVHGSHFYDRVFNILLSHHIQSFILKVGESVNGHPNDNGSNLRLKNFYGNEGMNCMRKHGDFKFTPAHMNYVLVEKWEAFKISSAKITQEALKNTRLIPLYSTDKDTNHQACFVDTQTPKGQKADEIN